MSGKHDCGENGLTTKPLKDFEIDCSNSDLSDNSSIPTRGKWVGDLDFLFGCINYAVGLGNVWRFPYLCYENGGGAFLLPYLICLVTCGIPAFFLEVSIGQYLSQGGIGVWEIVPIFKGVGYASMVIVALYNVYYVIIVAWILYYLFSSFTSELPWTKCDNWWNSPECVEIYEFRDKMNISMNNANITTIPLSPVVEFWEQKVLGGITTGLHDMGHINLPLVGLLFLSWALVYLVIYRGIHKSGKIIWFTAIFPYVILTILLIRGLSLDGSTVGVLYYLTPSWTKLLEPKVWVSAATQVFFTFGIGFGSVITLGSYNKFHHNYFRDAFILCFVNPGTSILAGFVIFSVIGHLSHVQGVPVELVVQSGPGLAFLTYPEVVSYLPISPLWAVLFFLMLLTLGLDSQFCTVEALVTGFVDEWPSKLRPHRKIFTMFLCFIMFLLGLPMIMQGGMYLFQLMDFYSASGITLLFTVFFQTICIAWVYGAEKMGQNIKSMVGHKPSIYFTLSWSISIPLVTFAIVIFSIVCYEPLVYAGTYVYPLWGNMLGWLIGLASMIWIPMYALYFLCTTTGTLKERLIAGVTPRIKPANISTESFMPKEELGIELIL